MYKANAINDATERDWNKEDNASTSTKTINNADRPEKVEGKVDIIILDKTNKTLILVSY